MILGMEVDEIWWNDMGLATMKYQWLSYDQIIQAQIEFVWFYVPKNRVGQVIPIFGQKETLKIPLLPRNRD